MPIVPIEAATDGFIGPQGGTLSIASRGLLGVGIIVFKKKDGSGAARAVEGYKLTAAQIAQLKREDEEVVAIISVIGEYLL